MSTSDFYTNTRYEVMHCDGWGYVVEPYDDSLIRIRYIEEDENGQSSNLTFDGLWPKSARKVAAALIALANELEPASEVTRHNTSEFQKGFYAGLAYANWGAEAVEAAWSVAKATSQQAQHKEGQTDPLPTN